MDEPQAQVQNAAAGQSQSQSGRSRTRSSPRWKGKPIRSKHCPLSSGQRWKRRRRLLTPLPLVASSALGALSLAIQPHVDMKRAEKLSGPVGLFLLTVADSGERKSTCDGFFLKGLRDYEEAQAEAFKTSPAELSGHRQGMGSQAQRCIGENQTTRKEWQADSGS